MAEPIATQQPRYPHIDAIRAAALFGVIVMNMGALAVRWDPQSVFGNAGPADFIAMALDLLFLQGKARSCFAFLFGLGFALMLVSAERKGLEFRPFYIRRMLALLLFGTINQIFLFWGDILVAYSLLGLILLLFLRRSDAALLKVGLSLVILPPLLAGTAELLTGAPLPNLVNVAPAQEAASGLAAYTSANYMDAIAHNAPQGIMRYATSTSFKIIYDLNVLGLFILGMWTARRRLLFSLDANRKRLGRIAALCIPIGFVISGISATRLAGIKVDADLYGLVTASYIGVPILAFGYIAGLTLLLSRERSRLQILLAPIGRMALTGYLASGAIGSWFFYGYGLGLMGEFGMVELNLFALALFASLGIFSHLWLRTFALGPAEWVWRCLSYGQWQPLSRSKRLKSALAG